MDRTVALALLDLAADIVADGFDAQYEALDTIRDHLERHGVRLVDAPGDRFVDDRYCEHYAAAIRAQAQRLRQDGRGSDKGTGAVVRRVFSFDRKDQFPMVRIEEGGKLVAAPIKPSETMVGLLFGDPSTYESVVQAIDVPTARRLHRELGELLEELG